MYDGLAEAQELSARMDRTHVEKWVYCEVVYTYYNHELGEIVEEDSKGHTLIKREALL
jgi:hypothetical protein